MWVFNFSWGTTRVWDIPTVQEETNLGVITWPEGAFPRGLFQDQEWRVSAEAPGLRAKRSINCSEKLSFDSTSKGSSINLLDVVAQRLFSFNELVRVGILSWENSLCLGNTGISENWYIVYVYIIQKALKLLCVEPMATTVGLKPGWNVSLYQPVFTQALHYEGLLNVHGR